MLSRNLLYTAVTRGKKLVVIVTDGRALTMALSETRREERLTGLRMRLQASK
jgi:exodeoxyribonuclease V alpha subunit